LYEIEAFHSDVTCGAVSVQYWSITLLLFDVMEIIAFSTLHENWLGDTKKRYLYHLKLIKCRSDAHSLSDISLSTSRPPSIESLQ